MASKKNCTHASHFHETLIYHFLSQLLFSRRANNTFHIPATMKRPFHNIVSDDVDIDNLTTTTSNHPPVVIEVGDCACCEASAPSLSEENPCKRARTCCGCTSLNLLVKAMERISRIPSNSGLVKVVDRVPSMCLETTAFTDSRSSSSASETRADEAVEYHRHPPPVSVKSTLYLKKPFVRLNSSRFPPVLPQGRPLMAPPRLPTNLRPGQVMLRNNRHKGWKL
jgi:hypothetical protein